MVEQPGFGPEEWPSYRLLILTELKRISADIELVDTKLDSVRTKDLPVIRSEIDTLKLKASAWGGLSGLVVALAAALWAWASRGGP